MSPGWYQTTGELSGERVPHIGWGQELIGGGETDVFVVDPVLVGSWVTVTISWDRITEHTGDDTYHYGDMFPPIGDPYTRMADLDLYFVDSDGSIVSSSVSTLQNEEHIFFQAPNTDLYRIIVFHAGGYEVTSTRYGIAWWIGDALSEPGDYDGSGSVGPEDYVSWRMTFGNSIAAGTGADGNGNSVIDAADYVVWRNAMTAGSGSRLVAVPEPTAALLTIVGLACGICFRRVRIT